MQLILSSRRIFQTATIQREHSWEGEGVYRPHIILFCTYCRVGGGGEEGWYRPHIDSFAPIVDRNAEPNYTGDMPNVSDCYTKVKQFIGSDKNEYTALYTTKKKI